MNSNSSLANDLQKSSNPVLVPREIVEVDCQKAMVGKIQNPPERVKAIYDGENIKSIVVTCNCGHVMNIECEYSAE